MRNMSITFEIPADISRLASEWPDLERHALEGFVMEAFRAGRLSTHEVGLALGVKDNAAHNFLSDRGAFAGAGEQNANARSIVANRLRMLKG